MIAHVSTVIGAPRSAVWAALTDPQTIKRYMFVSDVSSEWRPGGPIVWQSEWQGKAFEIHGVILRVETGRALAFTQSRPIFRSAGRARSTERDHRVTIELSDEARGTRISITSDDHTTKAELDHEEGGWRLVLNNLKALLEGARG